MIPYHEASRFLQTSRPPKFWASYHKLNRVLAFTQMVRVYHKLDPLGCEQALIQSDPISLAVFDEQTTAFETRVLAQVNALFPLDTDYLEMWLLEADEPLALHILPQGCPWTYDELSEVITDPQTCSASLSLEMFIIYLSMLIVRGEDWSTAATYFGWPDPGPPDPPKDSQLDTDHFFERLVSSGLTAFPAAFQIVWAETGNLFLDYNPYEDGVSYEPIPFDPTNVAALVEEWQQAQPLLADFRQACEQVAKKPELLQRLVDLFQECLGYE